MAKATPQADSVEPAESQTAEASDAGWGAAPAGAPTRRLYPVLGSFIHHGRNYKPAEAAAPFQTIDPAEPDYIPADELARLQSKLKLGPAYGDASGEVGGNALTLDEVSTAVEQDPLGAVLVVVHAIRDGRVPRPVLVDLRVRFARTDWAVRDALLDALEG